MPTTTQPLPKHIPFLDPQFPIAQLSAKKRVELITQYHNLDIHEYHHLLQKLNEEVWQQQGQKKALHLFHLAAKYIPAYQDFLKTHRIDPDHIRSFTDFQKIPPTDKPTYIDKYPLEKRTWPGGLSQTNIASFSSGSMNKPYIWPRSIYQDYEGAFAFEHLLTSLFHIHQKSTLFVNCFSMGNYVAGVYVYTSVKLMSHKGYPLTIVSPGINYEDIFNVLLPLKDQYDQIILAGYPPFIREVIELAPTKKLDLSKLNLKFFFASEFFSEDWRDQTLALTGNRQPILDSTNIYGTADSAIFSFETPTSILIRRLIGNDIKLNQSLFHSPLTPTLTQYNPLLTFYESPHQELILTSSSGVPLIRYNLKDQGGMLSYPQIKQQFHHHNLDLDDQLKQGNIDSAHTNLPFVYLTNRTDGAVSFYGIKIFPEYIRPGLTQSHLHPHVTGKFTLESTTDDNNNPLLLIHVEMTSTTTSQDLHTHVTSQVLESLRQRCSEFSFLENSLDAKAHPRVILHPFQTSNHFAKNIKQKWINQ